MSWPSISMRAGGRLLEAREHAQQRRLARARAAEQAEQLALEDVERDVVDRGDVAELLGDVADAHERLRVGIAPGARVGGDLRLLGHRRVPEGGGRGRISPARRMWVYWPVLMRVQARSAARRKSACAP